MDKIAGTVTYQDQLLRYQHDGTTGEFVNVGLVYFHDSAIRQLSSIKEGASSVLPPNDNALSFSPVFKGMDVDHTDAFKGLYDNLMNKYNGENLEEQAYLTINGHKTQKSGQKKETKLSPVLV